MTKKTDTTPVMTLDQLKIRLSELKLNIKAGLEKNTNAHKAIKKQISQLLTKQSKSQ
jgi:ribosomal protein L29